MRKKTKKRTKRATTAWALPVTTTTANAEAGSIIWYYPPKESFLTRFLRLLRGE